MVFWIAILAGGAFIWLAVRLGFYETWILSFNVLVAMYVSVFLAPTVAELALMTGAAGSYLVALSMVVLAGGCFAILQGLSYVFLTGQFSVTFPRVFDILLSGALGFAVGFLILSFVALILTTTPLAEQELVSNAGLNPESQKTTISYLAWSCDLIHSFAGFGDDADATKAAVTRLLDNSCSLGPHGAGRPRDANDAPSAPDRKAVPRQSGASKPKPRLPDDASVP